MPETMPATARSRPQITHRQPTTQRKTPRQVRDLPRGFDLPACLTGQCGNQAPPRPRRFHDRHLAHVGQVPYARWPLGPVICTQRYAALPSAEMTYGEDAWHGFESPTGAGRTRSRAVPLVRCYPLAVAPELVSERRRRAGIQFSLLGAGEPAGLTDANLVPENLDLRAGPARRAERERPTLHRCSPPSSLVMWANGRTTFTSGPPRREHLAKGCPCRRELLQRPIQGVQLAANQLLHVSARR